MMRSAPRAYGAYDEVAVSRATGISIPPEADCCQQQFAAEADINEIVRRFGGAGLQPVATGGVYGDFTGVTDYWSALEKLERAQADFMHLPPEVREQYGNDPGAFLAATAAMSDDELDAVVPVAEPPAPAEAPVAPVVAPEATPPG